MEKTLRVKLFGESFKVHKIKIDSKLFSTFQSISNKLKEPLELALLNAEFFRILDMNEIQSLNDVYAYTFSGLINNYRNQMEIYYGRKRLMKFQLEELFSPSTLFPLFNTEVIQIHTNHFSPGIYIQEVEIGLVGIYEIDVESFQVDLLKFNLSKIEISNTSCELLNAMYYENKKLIKVKSDTLLRSQFSFQHL